MQKLTKFAEEGDTLYKKKKKMETITTTPLLQYFALNAGHFIKYKWLLKDTNGKLFCKPCTQVPERL